MLPTEWTSTCLGCGPIHSCVPARDHCAALHVSPTPQARLVDAVQVVKAESEPVSLGTKQLEQLVRALTMLGHVAPQRASRLDYLVTAQQYAVKLLTQVLLAAGAQLTQPLHSVEVAANAAAAAEAVQQEALAAAAAAAVNPLPVSLGRNKPSVPSKSPTAPTAAAAALPGTLLLPALAVEPSDTLPATLAAWGSWDLPPRLLQSLERDTTPLGLAAANMAQPELLIAYLEQLQVALCSEGRHLQCLPLAHLTRLVAFASMRSEVSNPGTSLVFLCAGKFIDLTFECWYVAQHACFAGLMCGVDTPHVPETSLAGAVLR